MEWKTFYRINAFILTGALSFLIFESMIISQDEWGFIPSQLLTIFGRMVLIYLAGLLFLLPFVMVRKGFIPTGGTRKDSPEKFRTQLVFVILFDFLIILYLAFIIVKIIIK